jgi:PhzF family phenazine biosynthesis protein
MSDTLMQALAREFNLAESTFVTPPEAGTATHRVRIFTPRAEVPFAGHPTVGTAGVLAYLAGGVGLQSFTLQENVGEIAVSVDMTADRLVASLNLPLDRVSTGPAVDAPVARMLSLAESDVIVRLDMHACSRPRWASLKIRHAAPRSPRLRRCGRNRSTTPLVTSAGRSITASRWAGRAAYMP